MRQSIQDKIDKALMHCYRQLYAHATPPARFDDLPYLDKESKFYMDHEIEQEVMDEIIQQTIKDFKIPKMYIRPFEITILLGCSPKTKRNGTAG